MGEEVTGSGSVFSSPSLPKEAPQTGTRAPGHQGLQICAADQQPDLHQSAHLCYLICKMGQLSPSLTVVRVNEMMDRIATSYSAHTNEILVLAVIRLVAGTVFNHTRDRFKMSVCLCAHMHPRKNWSSKKRGLNV